MASLARRRPGKLLPPVTLGRFSTTAVESDVIIIGGGHVGSTAAFVAGEMGFKTTCIEKRGLLGRIFPYNTLVHLSGAIRLSRAKHANFMANGPEEKSADFPTANARKEKSTACLNKGFESPTEVSVDTNEGDKVVVRGKKIIIATGTRLESTYSGNIVIDEKRIVSSVGALSLTDIPKRAVVIGANCRGLEIGSVWGQFGTKVMVVDVAADIFPTMDGEIREKFRSKLVKQNLEFMLETRVVGGGIEVIDKRSSSIVPGVYAIGDVAARKTDNGG